MRVALPLTEVRDRVRVIRWVLAAGFGLATAVGLIGLVLIVRSLNRPLRRPSESVDRLGSGDLTATCPSRGPRSW